MNKIQLYSYPTSPYAQKVACYLYYKNIDFDFIPVNPINNEQIKFTNQRQVPVLKIDNEWRKESSELGKWLEALFPQNPILPEHEQQLKSVLEVDHWISNSLIPSYFRNAVEWQNTWNSITNGWRLARAVSNATPLPFYIRFIWPFAVKRAGFIVDMVHNLNLNESFKDMNHRLQKEFIAHLKNGPFLCGHDQPSLADLSAFPIITSSHFMGMKSKQSLLQHPEIKRWAQRVHNHLPNNPLLVPIELLNTTEL